MLTKKVGTKEYAYIVEEFSNGNKVDYSKGLEVEITEDVYNQFIEMGGLYKSLFFDELAKKTHTYFQLLALQLSSTDFSNILVFLEDGVLKEYKITTDSQFVCALEARLNTLAIPFKEVCTFEQLNKAGYDTLGGYIFEPTSVYGTGLFTSEKEEVLYGGTYKVEVNETNNKILSLGYFDLSSFPISHVEVMISGNVGLFNYIGKVEYILDNGEKVPEEMVNYLSYCLEKKEPFKIESFNKYLENYELNFAHKQANVTNNTLNERESRILNNSNLTEEEKQVEQRKLYERLDRREISSAERYFLELKEELKELDSVYFENITGDVLRYLFQ